MKVFCLSLILSYQLISEANSLFTQSSRLLKYFQKSVLMKLSKGNLKKSSPKFTKNIAFTPINQWFSVSASEGVSKSFSDKIYHATEEFYKFSDEFLIHPKKVEIKIQSVSIDEGQIKLQNVLFINPIYFNYVILHRNLAELSVLNLFVNQGIDFPLSKLRKNSVFIGLSDFMTALYQEDAELAVIDGFSFNNLSKQLIFVEKAESELSIFSSILKKNELIMNEIMLHEPELMARLFAKLLWDLNTEFMDHSDHQQIFFRSLKPIYHLAISSFKKYQDIKLNSFVHTLSHFHKQLYEDIMKKNIFSGIQEEKKVKILKIIDDSYLNYFGLSIAQSLKFALREQKKLIEFELAPVQLQFFDWRIRDYYLNSLKESNDFIKSNLHD